MADRYQVRRIRDDGYADTDPLAELTRIMGFDPRVEPEPSVADFGIDLERELTGDFDADPAEATVFHRTDRDALGAGREADFASADDWHPDEQAPRHALPVTRSAPESSNLAENDVVIDFSGQLSHPGDLLPGTASGSADVAHDLEAELSALLGAFGSAGRDEGLVHEAVELQRARQLAAEAEIPVLAFEPEPFHLELLPDELADGFGGDTAIEDIAAEANAEQFEFAGENQFEAAGGEDGQFGPGFLFDDSEFEAALEEEFLSASEGDSVAADEQAHQTDEQPAAHSASIEADPFAALALMGLPSMTAAAAPGVDSYAGKGAGEEPARWEDARYDENVFGLVGDRFAPEIETVEVPERAVALPDDLDLPHVAFEEERPAPIGYDDLDAEFSGAFGNPAAAQPAAAFAAGRDGDDAALSFDEEFSRLFEFGESEEASSADHGIAPIYAAAPQYEAMSAPTQSSAVRFHTEALAYDPEFETEAAGQPSSAEISGQIGRNRGFAVAAVVAGLAFAGGLGAFALSFGGGAAGEPPLVKAEAGPVKVKPENPGGTVVPNQDNKVYERVTEGVLEPPSQDRLISGTEEPVDLAAREFEPVAAALPGQITAAENLPGVDLRPDVELAENSALAKAEDRIEPEPDIASLIASDELAAVAPRRVRTMVVRPDGTLMPREELAPPPAEPTMPQVGATPEPGASADEAVAAELPPAAAPSLAPVPLQPTEAAAQPALVTAEQAISASPAVLPAADAAAAAASAALQQLSLPATLERVPVAPSRPSDQPADLPNGGGAREQVASLAAPAPAVSTGGWSMQIASQPSPEGAQATYENLARRYGSVLGGRGVNIVKAEIAGKGTFWRVRVPAGSRSEATALCEQYKGAGGSCFVAQ